MSRPPLTLSDAAARSLVQQIEGITARHAHEPRQHRPFVHDFVRAVYHATGATYSAAFYRKLLKAYAPARTPSTPTIETEKQLLVQELRARAMVDASQASDATSDVPSMASAPMPVSPGIAEPSTGFALQQIVGLQHHTIALLNGLANAPATTSAPPGLQAHVDYLSHRLSASENELGQTRATASRLAAQLQEQQALVTERAAQLAALQATIDTQVSTLSAMAKEMADTRQFMAMAVDGVRGETRAVRERCAYLEAQLKEKEQQAETYRQMVFNRTGGPLPKTGQAR